MTTAAAARTPNRAANPTPSTVQSALTPGVGVDGSDRTDREERRQGHGDAHGDHGSDQDRCDDADEPVQRGRRRIGPDGAHDDQVALAGAQLPGDELHPEQQRSQAGDGAEDPQCERLGPYRLLGLRLHLCGDLKVGEVPLGRIPPPLHGGDVGRAAP